MSTQLTDKPTGQQLVNIAYLLTSGDAASKAPGSMNRHPEAKDALGINKLQVIRHTRKRHYRWFSQALQRVLKRGRRLIRSTRTYVRNDLTGKVRPIDQAPIPLQLFQVLIAHELENIIATKGGLHDAVVGFRSGRDFAYVPVAGATIQDQYAGRIVTLIKRLDYQADVVVVDLEDAFGRIPHQAIHAALKDLGLNLADRRLVVELSRLFSQEKTGRPVDAIRGEGIEQGSALGPLVFSIVMSFVARKLQENGIQAAMFGDDIVLVSPKGKGEEHFEVFKQITGDMGFTNVRGLDDPRKPTRVVRLSDFDLPRANRTFEIIKTYGISLRKDGDNQVHVQVGLTAKKTKKLRKKLREISRAGSVGEIRQLAGSKIISKSWMREEGLISPAVHSSSETSASEEETNANPGRLRRVGGAVVDPEEVSTETHRSEEVVLHSGQCCRGSDGGGHDVLVEDQERGIEDTSKGVGAHDSTDTCMGSSRGDEALAGSSPSRSYYQSIYLLPKELVLEEEGVERSSGEASERSLGVVTDPESSRGRVFAPPAAALLPAADQDDQRQINREDLKGHVVDLSRINQPVELEDLRKVVAEAVDLVAIRKEAWVLVHPGDDWTRHPGLLGNPEDPSWEARSRRPHPRGQIVKLYRRAWKPARVLPTRPTGASVILKVGPPGPNMRRTVTWVSHDGEHRKTRVTVTSRSMTWSWWQAVAAVSTEIDGAMAIRHRPDLKMLLHNNLRLGVLWEASRLLRRRTWSRNGEWWIGT